MLRKTASLVVCVLVLLSAGVIPSSAVEDVLPSGIPYTEIGKEIEAFVSGHEDQTAGVATAVFDRCSVIYDGYFGYANKEEGLAVDEQTVMEWGSVTKLTVWVSVMQLWEQGKLDLNQDIRTYLPERFLRNLRYQTPITMLDLMNHKAGFEELVFGMTADRAEDIIPLEKALSRYQPVQRFEPGVVQAYSNYGAALAGYIVERISGQPYSEYVKEHIFDPLDMRHTAILPDLSDNPWVRTQRDLLHCYEVDGPRIEPDRMYLNWYPAGMCTSTLNDLMLFGQALLDPESPLFQSADTYHTLFTPTAFYGDTDLPTNCHGFWCVAEFPGLVSHNGGTYGCSSFLGLDLQSGIGMAVLTNQGGGTLFSGEMPGLVFRETEPPKELDSGASERAGFAESSRNIWTGPLKLSRLFKLERFSDVSYFTVKTNSHRVERYSASSEELLPIRTSEVVFMYAMVILWALAALFSLIWLLIRLLQRLLRKKKPVLGLWEILSCGVMLSVPIALVPMLRSMFQKPLWYYRLLSIGCFVACLAMALLLVLGVLRFRKLKTRKEKALLIVLLAALLISLGNILYWNLFMFWMTL